MMAEHDAPEGGVLSNFNREDLASLNWTFKLYERLRKIIMASSIEDAAARTTIELLESVDASSVTIAVRAGEGFRVLASYIPAMGFDNPLTGKSVGETTPPESLAAAMGVVGRPVVWRSRTGKPVSDWFVFPCFVGVPVMDEDDAVIGAVVAGFADPSFKPDNGIVANAEIFAGAFSVTYGRMSELARLSHEVKNQERQRMVQQIHDSAIQNLFSAELNIKSVAEMDALPTGASTLLDDASAAVTQAKADLRKIIFETKTAKTEKLCAADVIAREIDEHDSKQGVPITTTLRIVREPPERECEAMRMVVHECLANVRKHAHASTAHISVLCDDNAELITVQDDGVGFGEKPIATTDMVENLHFGLDNIQLMAEELGGAMDADDDDVTGGAAVFVRIPIDWRGL